MLRFASENYYLQSRQVTAAEKGLEGGATQGPGSQQSLGDQLDTEDRTG